MFSPSLSLFLSSPLRSAVVAVTPRAIVGILFKSNSFLFTAGKNNNKSTKTKANANKNIKAHRAYDPLPAHIIHTHCVTRSWRD